MELNEQNRNKLDGIVQQMIANGEPDENVRFVVEDFKKKYTAQPENIPGLFSGEYSGPTGTVAPGESLPHAAARQVIGGVGAIAKGIPGMLKDVAQKGPERVFLEPQIEQFKQAWQLAREKRFAEAAGHGLAGLTPGVGPMVASATERALTGTLGPAAELATFAAAPGVARETMPYVRPGVAKVRAAATGSRNVLIGPKVESIPATDAFIKSTVPRNSIKNIRETVDRGLPDARRAADSLGMDLDKMTLQDAEQAVVKAKSDVWDEFESQRLGPNEAVPISTDTVSSRIRNVADGMTDIQKHRLRVVKPNGQSNINHPINKAIGDYEGKTLTLREINNRIQELNNQLRSQQSQFKVNEMALRRDPKFAPLYAELDGLRDLESVTLDRLTGPGSKELKQRYGSLKVMEDVISRRIPIAERKPPVGAFQGLGRIAGLGNVVAGGWETITGHPTTGIPNVLRGGVQLKAGLNAQELNNPHVLIRQAFKATTPRP